MAAPTRSSDSLLHRCTVDDVDLILSAPHLFDDEPTADLTRVFLAKPGNHLVLALVDGSPVGFVSGIEITHPDKEPEMLLYELGVDESHRREGHGKELVLGLAVVAQERSCRGMWVPVDPDNRAAIATYRSAGAEEELSLIMSWNFPPPRAGAA